MISCDYISKSMLSKAKKRIEYEAEYDKRDRKLTEIDQVKPRAKRRKTAVLPTALLTIGN